VNNDVPAIRLRGLHKAFGSTIAVDHVDLDIRAGEFFSMLGPSGSGKTTVLRMIAGFETPTSGTVELFGEDVTHNAPFDRNVNTVFQDYALFPHMSVLDNVAYGLRVRGMAKKERYELAQDALDKVRLSSFGKRKPSQLSGGQRQRVALARATVLQPKVLLLDEPLGALDLKLREQMQVELKEIQRELGITFIFVTHDQEEALTLSDRIAVFNEGKIVQLGSPAEVYDEPKTHFVASFVGTSNIFDAAQSQTLFGESSIHSVRPEKISVGAPGSAAIGEIQLDGVIAEIVFVGSGTRIIVDTEDGMRVIILEQNDQDGRPPHNRGDQVRLSWRRSDVIRLAADTMAAAPQQA